MKSQESNNSDPFKNSIRIETMICNRDSWKQLLIISRHECGKHRYKMYDIKPN